MTTRYASTLHDFAAGFPSSDHPVRPCCTPRCSKGMTPQFHFCQLSHITKDDVVGILGTRMTPCEVALPLGCQSTKPLRAWPNKSNVEEGRRKKSCEECQTSMKASLPTQPMNPFISQAESFVATAFFGSCPETSGSLRAFTETTLTTLRCHDSAPSYTIIFEGMNFAVFHEKPKVAALARRREQSETRWPFLARPSPPEAQKVWQCQCWCSLVCSNRYDEIENCGNTVDRIHIWFHICNFLYLL